MVSSNVILRNAHKCGLSVRLDSLTIGDGNCWYHAVVQQIRRPEIYCRVDSKYRNIGHRELRAKVSSYVRDIHMHCPNIILYKTAVLNRNPNMTWELYLQGQSTNNIMADDIFIMATAVLIGLDIHINSAHCNPTNPATVIKRYWQEPDEPEEDDLPFLIIGHSQLHFQSLIPVTTNTNESCSYSDVIHTSRKRSHIGTNTALYVAGSLQDSSGPSSVVLPTSACIPKNNVSSSLHKKRQ